jgi:hypothetical protein
LSSKAFCVPLVSPSRALSAILAICTADFILVTF